MTLAFTSDAAFEEFEKLATATKITLVLSKKAGDSIHDLALACGVVELERSGGSLFYVDDRRGDRG